MANNGKIELNVHKLVKGVNRAKKIINTINNLINDDIERKQKKPSVVDEASDYNFSQYTDIDDKTIPDAYERFYQVYNEIFEDDDFFYMGRTFMRCVPMDNEILRAMTNYEDAFDCSRKQEKLVKRGRASEDILKMCLAAEKDARWKLIQLTKSRVNAMFNTDPFENQEYLKTVSKYMKKKRSKERTEDIESKKTKTSE